MQQRLQQGKCSKDTPVLSMPSTSLKTEPSVERLRGEKRRELDSLRRDCKKEWFTIWKKNKHHKECVTLEQTEQTQIKHVRNEKKKQNKESKPTKLELAVGEVLWWFQATSRGRRREPHLKCTCLFGWGRGIFFSSFVICHSTKNVHGNYKQTSQ